MEENIGHLTILADKHIFIHPNEQEFECLETHLTKQLEAGQGECFIEIGTGEGQTPGLGQSDLEASTATLQALAHRLSAQLLHLRDRCVGNSGTSTAPLSGTTDCKPSASPNANSPNPTHGENNTAEILTASTDSPIASDSNTPTASGSSRRQQGKKRSKQNQPDSPTLAINESTNATSVDSTVTSPTSGLIVREYLLRRDAVSEDFVDVRVAVVGNVDAGKSTLLGVLTHGELDNGRGLARLRLFRHKHEAESGRTSSVSNDILGFDANGKVVNRPSHGQLDWSQICAAAAKVVTFIDLAGHERYLKTTIFGMTGHAPDYAMLMVGANAGMIGMAKEHLGLALALAVPVFVVVTKIDMCPPNVLQETMNLLFRILKSPGCRKIPILVANKDDVICSATNFTSERMCPIFTVSNVTGEHLDLLTMFLNLLSPRALPRVDEPAHFQIDDIFSVQGVGTVVSGTCLSGLIKLNDILLLGPDAMGQFAPIPIRSIHRKRLPVTHVRGGQTASFALKRLKRNQIRKGMVLISPERQPQAALEFTAEVLILHHPTTIWVGYQAMVHAGPVRQSATIVAIAGRDRLRTGDKDQVQFRFMKHPEYMHIGIRLIFREGKTKAVGTVVAVVPYTAPTVQTGRSRLLKKLPNQSVGPSGAPQRSTGQGSTKSAPGFHPPTQVALQQQPTNNAHNQLLTGTTANWHQKGNKRKRQRYEQRYGTTADPLDDGIQSAESVRSGAANSTGSESQVAANVDSV